MSVAKAPVATVTQAVEALVRKTIALSDDDMGSEWKWGVYDEEGLRFALLMAHHELRDLAVRLAAAREREPAQAARILAQYHQAYRDLSGLLASVRTDDLDRVSAEGEWPVREVCKHMLGAEYGFLAVTRLGLERALARNASEPSDEEWNAFRAPIAVDRDKATASIATADIEGIRNAFAEIHIRVLRELRDITDDQIEAPAWFWDGAMPLRFRLHRFEEHLRQHTIQLDKTLLGIGRPPTEAHRLVRNIYNALADVEMERGAADDLRATLARTIAERAAAV
ncbi:MAG: DinB family protein [Chloroflexi bacterium]|nr:MAG: DinB family protein [Chloroflexota bacterium]